MFSVFAHLFFFFIQGTKICNVHDVNLKKKNPKKQKMLKYRLFFLPHRRRCATYGFYQRIGSVVCAAKQRLCSRPHPFSARSAFNLITAWHTNEEVSLVKYKTAARRLISSISGSSLLLQLFFFSCVVVERMTVPAS